MTNLATIVCIYWLTNSTLHPSGQYLTNVVSIVQVTPNITGKGVDKFTNQVPVFTNVLLMQWVELGKANKLLERKPLALKDEALPTNIYPIGFEFPK